MTKSYNLWLANVPGISIMKASALLNYFTTAQGIYEASQKSLYTTGLPQKLIDTILAAKKIAPEQYADILSKKDIKFVDLYDYDYPSLLKEIPEPPLGLYIKGSMPTTNAISIVGSRKCTEYGMLTAVKMSKYLADCGISIVSGMARGIDSFAHKGALEANGHTVAVLGCGVDICYPSENRSLYEKILKTGTIISEYFPGVPPKTHHFPLRNRIISGLSLAVLVVEAGKSSGSLITADKALDQGRDVFAVPGNITSSLSLGTNNLIKEGATLITHPEEIIEFLGLERELLRKKPKKAENNTPPLAPEEKLVYDYIVAQETAPVTVDEIIAKIDIPIPQVNYALTMLELNELVERLPGGRYTKK
ncbi:MAG: DNA-processing protein DprA [Defluviitaleaceae bacterium]|nr:DNA-processing protein DprA [Defluviitaleaceae bacterium]